MVKDFCSLNMPDITGMIKTAAYQKICQLNAYPAGSQAFYIKKQGERQWRWSPTPTDALNHSDVTISALCGNIKLNSISL